MDAMNIRPPSPRDRIEKSSLPHKVKQALRMAGVATFRGVANRSPYRIFESLMLWHCMPQELTLLNGELAKRGLSFITTYGALESGPGKLPVTVVERLWHHRVYTGRELAYKNYTQLALAVGVRNVPSLLRYLKQFHKMDPTESIYWYADQGFPRKALPVLDRLRLSTVEALLSDAAMEKHGGRGAALIELMTLSQRDKRRVVLYARWWFSKYHPRIMKKYTAAP